MGLKGAACHPITRHSPTLYPGHLPPLQEPAGRGERPPLRQAAAAASAPQPAAPRPEALPAKLALSALSAAQAEAVTFPIDLVKTRLQLQGGGGGGVAGAVARAAAAPRLGALAMALHVTRTEGLGALYAGLSPAILRHIPYTGGCGSRRQAVQTGVCGG